MQSSKSLRILLLEPFMGESHREWAEGLACHSRHSVTVWGLAGRHWKWRMHGAAETFARRFMAERPDVDLILASDMLDLAGFLAHTRRLTSRIPTAVYFHENQFAYPWSPTDPDPKLQRDHHYAYLNYRSALVADAALFNSRYNMESFLLGANSLLPAFPDHQNLDSLPLIRAKCSVLPLGLELPRRTSRSSSRSKPLVLWNHRWEHDKGPEAFFEGLMLLAHEGMEFDVAVLGRAYNKVPSIFEAARKTLGDRIVSWGYLPNRTAYWEMLESATLLPVTSVQDFFGASVVEAMHSGVVPLLPQALAYPEHIPLEWQSRLLYGERGDFVHCLRSLLLAPANCDPSTWVAKYSWEACIGRYDDVFEQIATLK